MYQPIRELLGPLIVRDSAQDRPAQREQVDEPDLLLNRRATQRCLGLKALDLRLEIAECDRAVRDHGFRHGATTFGGLGGAKYGKTLDDQAIGPSMPSRMRGPFPPLM